MKTYIKNENQTYTLTISEKDFENHFCFCEDCGTLLFINDAVRISDVYYCESCTTSCVCCGTVIAARDAYQTCDSDYDYCHDCYVEQTYRCDDCGARYRYEDELHEVNDYWYCDTCYENHRPIINSYHTQKEYGKIVFYGNADRRDELHIGWELEVDSDHRVDRERIAGGVKDILSNFIACEDDGSLSSQAGFEIISQPASLKYHLSMMPKYTEAFEYLTDNEMLSHDAGTCGFHIHADSRYLGTGFKLDAALSKLLYITEKFYDEILKFGRRNRDQADNWCRSRKERYTTEAGWIKKAVYKNRSGFSYQDRYFGLNLSNLENCCGGGGSGSIEFRYFRGSLVPETIEASLKLVARLMEISKTVRAVDLAKFTFDDILGDDPTIRSYWNRISNK